MVNPAESEFQAPTSILDIITYGYKKVFRMMGPLSKLTLPVMLGTGVLSGIYHAQAIGIKLHPSTQGIVLLAISGILYFVAILLQVYLYYCTARYVRDIYWEDVPAPLLTYLRPNKTLLGCIGIGFLTMLAMIPAGIVGVLGLFLLVVPGVVIFSYSLIVSKFVYLVYLGRPNQGVAGAISEAIQLVKGNFWRTVGLGVVTYLIYFMVAMPFGIFQGILAFLTKTTPTFTQSLLFPILYGLSTTGINWCALAIGYAGLVSILYRYYFDLKVRSQDKTLMAEEPLSLGLSNVGGRSGTKPVGLAGLRMAEMEVEE